MNKLINIEFEETDLHILIVSAFRYALGRQSYVPSMFGGFIRQQWDLIPSNTKNLLIRELEEAVKENDETYDASSFSNKLGLDCDIHTWKTLLQFMKGT